VLPSGVAIAAQAGIARVPQPVHAFAVSDEWTVSLPGVAAVALVAPNVNRNDWASLNHALRP
jgi:hypothetical protein